MRLGCYQDSCTGVAPAYETGRMRPRGDGAGRRVGVPGRGASRGGVGRAGRLTDELRARLSTSPLTRPEESKGLRATLRAGDHRHTPPEIAWELSLGIWLIVKGFRPSPILSADAGRARRGSSTRLPLSHSPAKAAASLVLNIDAAAISVAATSSDTFVVGRLGRHGSSRPARRSQFKMDSCASGLTGVAITPRHRQERPRVGIRAKLKFQDAER